MIHGLTGGASGFCRTQLFAVLFSILMVTSIVAPVGAVDGSTGGEVGEWADGTEGLLSADQDGDEETSSAAEDESTSIVSGVDEPPSEGDADEPDTSDGTDETETASADSISPAIVADPGDCIVDGTGDSIQDAINSSTRDSTICVEAGTYDEELTIDVEGLTLQADGNGEVILEGGDERETAIEVTADDVTVEGFTVQNYTASMGVIAVDGGERFELRNSTIADSGSGVRLAGNPHESVLIENEILGNDGPAIDIVSGDGHTIEANEISYNDDHAIIGGQPNAQYVQIVDNEIHDNRGGAVELDYMNDAIIESNNVTKNDGGILIGLRATVTDNYLAENLAEPILMSGGITTARSSTVRGNAIEDVEGTGIETNDRSTIEGNQVTNAGKTGIEINYHNVTVQNNTVSGHDADLRIDLDSSFGHAHTIEDNVFETGVLLTSVPDDLHEAPPSMSNNTVGGDDLFYAAGGSDLTVPEGAGQVILVDVANANVSGLVIDGVISGIQVVHSDGVTITDNELATTQTNHNARTGSVTVWNSTGAAIERNVITESDDRAIYVVDSDGASITDNRVEGASWAGIAIGQEHVISFEGTTTVSNNEIETDLWGVHVNSVDHVDILDNEIPTSDRGIYIEGVEHLLIDGNTIQNADSEGLRIGAPRSMAAISPADDVEVTNNVITGSGSHGIEVDGRDGTTIESNTVTDNADRGIFADFGGDAGVILDNELRNNDVGLYIYSRDDAAVAIHDNAIADNDQGVVYDGDGTLNATSNWWGDESGPSGEGDGDGDAVGANVDYEPWLESDPFHELPATFELSTVETNSPVNAGDELAVDVTVTNTGDVTGKAPLTLEDFDGVEVDTVSVDLDAGASMTETLTWETTTEDIGSGDVTVGIDEAVEAVHVNVRTEAGDEPVTCGPITEPGTYELTNDLEASSSCIEIESDDVVLDGMGHTVSAIEGGTAVVADDVENVTVRNLTISGWPTGVQFADVTDATVEDVETANTTIGVDLAGQSTNVSVERTTVTDSMGVAYRVGDQATGNTFTRIEATASGEMGALLIEGDTNEVSNATVTDPWSNGIVVEGADNAITDVAVTGSPGSGVVARGDGNMIVNATVTVPDASGTGGHGAVVLVDGAQGTELRGSTVDLANLDDGLVGISVLNAPDTQLIDNTIVSGGATESAITLGYSQLHAPGTTVTALTIDNGGTLTTSSFEATGAVGIAGVPSPLPGEIPTPPADIDSIETYLDVFDLGEPRAVVDDDTGDVGAVGEVDEPGVTESTIDLAIHYDGADVETIDESTLAIWSIDDEDQPWTAVDGSTVDTDDRTVSASFDADALVNGTILGVFADAGVDLEFSDVEIDAESIVTGETVTVSATVENVGSENGTATVPLEVDGVAVANQTVTLDADESDTISIEHAFEEPGEFDVSLAGVSVATVTVLADADLVVYGVHVDQDEVFVDDPLTVTVDLFNGGDVEGTYHAELFAGGDRVAEVTETVDGDTVAPGAVELTWTPDASNLPEEETSAEIELAIDGFTETVTVTNAYSDVQVIAASASTSELVAGEELYAIGSVYQAGTIDGPQTIDLTATPLDDEGDPVGDPIHLGDEELTVSPNVYYLGALNVSATIEEAGTYELHFDDRSAGTVEVLPAESDIQVIAASASTDEIVAGENVSTIGSVYQAGTIDGPQTIDLTATPLDGDGAAAGEPIHLTDEELTVAPNVYHLGALNLSATIEEAGTYELHLGERYAGTVEVLPAESDIQVIAASASTTEIVAGEELYAVGSVYQAGTISGPQTINMTAEDVDTGETIHLGDEELTVSPNVYHLGSLNVSATIDEAGTYELYYDDRLAGTVEVFPAESDVQVIAAATDAEEIVAGESFHTIGSVYQAGTISGPQTINLTATPIDEDGEADDDPIHLGDEELTVSPNVYYLGALNVSATIEEAGTYELRYDDRSAGTIEVLPAVSDIQVIAASVSEMNASVGQELHAVGSVYQNGTIDGPQTVNLTATNLNTSEETVIGTELTVAPNVYYLGALNVSFTPDEAGVYELELGERSAGTVYVEESPSDIQVIAASLSEIEVLEGEQLNVTGSIYQNGTGDVSQTIELTAIDRETGETVALGNQSMTLQAGFYYLGAIEIDFVIDQHGTYDLYLDDHHAGELEVIERYTDIQVIAASASTDEIVAGEELYAVGSVYQAGTISGPQTINMTATPLGGEGESTGEPIHLGSEELTVSPNVYHLGALNVSATIDEAGTYEIRYDDRLAGTVEVLPAESDVQVIAASASTEEIVAGEELYAVGSVYQAGTISGPQTINFTAEDVDTGETIHLGDEELTVSPNVYHLGALNVSATIDEAGTYEIRYEDKLAGTVEVLPAESDLQVIAASASQPDLVVGQSTNVIGSVYQAGTIEGPQTIELTATHLGTGETTVVESEELTVAPNVYYLGAINASFAPEETGTYALTLGDRDAGEVVVEEPTVEATIASVEGHAEGVHLDTGSDLVYANDDATVEIDVEADIDLAEVTLLVESLDAPFATSTNAIHDGDDRWTVDVPFEQLPDDGTYALTVVATDERGNGDVAEAPTLLEIDRDAPTLSVSLEDVTSDDATVVVESDEPLSGVPIIEGGFEELESATTSSNDPSVTLESNNADNTTFTGTLTFDDTGEYTVNVIGTDRAGNEGNASTSIVHYEFTLGDDEIEIEGTGVSIAFDVIDEATAAIQAENLAMALAENAQDANLDGSAHGVGFLSTELPGLLDAHLEGATIKMAIDEEELPTGFDASDVELQYFDSGAGEWNGVDSSVEYVGDEPSLVADVTGFSTYGVVVPDTTAPSIDLLSPNDGYQFDAGTSNVTVEFAYGDDLSGVDVGSVEVLVDGEPQTDPGKTTIDSTGATHTHDVDDGQSYAVTLTVADEAGNVATETLTFSVAEPAGGGGGGAPGPAPPSPDDPDSDDVEDSDAPDAEDEGTDDESEPEQTDGVEDSDDAEAGDADDGDDSIPGFGLGAAMLVLLLVIVRAPGLFPLTNYARVRRS